MQLAFINRARSFADPLMLDTKEGTSHELTIGNPVPWTVVPLMPEEKSHKMGISWIDNYGP